MGGNVTSEPVCVQIMVVDDNTVDCMAVERALRKEESCTVQAINDPQVALQLLRDGTTHWPILVLLDLDMPRMSGLDFLAELRNDPRLREVLVFVLTTSQADEDRKLAYEMNVAGYINKQRVAKKTESFREFFRQFLRFNAFPPAPKLREAASA